MENETKKKWGYFVRFVIGAVFFIVAFNFTSTGFFAEYPLLGIPFLAEVVIATTAGLVGFSLVPKYFLSFQRWLEDVIGTIINKLVNDFWTQYMNRMEENRSKRQKEQRKKRRKKTAEKVKEGILVDTSVLIDGRILEVAKTGFLLVPLVVTKSVINELHLLSDNGDDMKRKKGRRGLDLLNKLKKECKVVIITQKGDFEGVDEELVKLAKNYKLDIMTLDFNLNKVAQVSNIKVLNLNDLAESLKPDFIPGEELKVKIVQKGKEKRQGLAYLDDGTMVVVDNADKLLDSEVEVVVTKLIQTSAGKMVFSELKK